MQIWDLWYPYAAAQGLSFGRGRLEPTDVLLVHAAPDVLRVEVRDDTGVRLAFGDQLRRSAETPIARLNRVGGTIVRVDLWPEPEDIGRPVILPGGEAGILRSWWNADDGSMWRWQVEFYNER